MKFIERGAGPAVILLHGSPSTVESMEPLIERLSRGHRVLAPWLPGYGDSPEVEGTLQPAGLWRHVAQWMGSVGVQRGALVGFSRGAYHALGIALTAPERVTHLVLLAGYAGRSGDEFVALADALSSGALSAAAIEQMLPERMLSERGRKLPGAIQEVKSWARATTLEHFVAELRSAPASPDLTGRLHELEVPVLLRVGELDQACPPAFSRAIAEAVPRAELQIVPGAAHALLVEDPETPGAVEHFLRGR